MKSPLSRPLVVSLLALGFSVTTAPAINLVFDYTHDTFFSANPTAKLALEAAAADIGSVIFSPLSAIGSGQQTITGTYGDTAAEFTWNYTYIHPVTGVQTTRPTTALAADTFVIYAGARGLLGSTLGQGATGGISYSWSGNGFEDEWEGAMNLANSQSNAVYGRGGEGPVMQTLAGNATLGSVSASFSVSTGPSIGSLWFDIDGDNNGAIDGGAALNNYWHFDHTTSVAAGKNDFYSVALHEILHTLGVGSAQGWNDLITGTTWEGDEVTELYGSGANKIEADGKHIASGLMSQRLRDGATQEVAMDPSIVTGTRKELTIADLAFLQDMGWQTSLAVPEPSAFSLAALGVTAWVLRRKRSLGGVGIRA